jgi:hypothetical protein
MESGLLRQIFVMPGLVPGIHVLGATSKEDVDGRDKPGHDEKATHSQYVRQRLRTLAAFSVRL